MANKKSGLSSKAQNLRKKAETIVKNKSFKTGFQLSETEMLRLIHELEVHKIELELQNQELREANEQVKVAAEKYAELYDFAPLGYFTLSREGRIIELNLNGAKMFGKERSLLINSRFGFFISENTKPDFNHFIERVFKSRSKETCELALIIDGIPAICVHLTGIAIDNEEKCFVQMIDITNSKRMEEQLKLLNTELENRVTERTAELLKSNTALQQNEEIFRTVADFTYEWEYWMNPEGFFIYVSPSCERITGYTAMEFMADKDLIYKIIHPDDLNSFSNHVAHRFRSKHAMEIEFRIITKENNVRWIGHVCRPIFINGKYLGLRVSNRDNTEKIKAENELLNVTVEVEERERKHFSHELHDELGPLLSTIKLYFQWLAETDDAEKIKIITEKGNNSIETAIQATREMAQGVSSLFLYDSGYVDAVVNFIQRINDTHQIVIDFTFNSRNRFSNYLEIILYRITAELINNTLKHARATHAEIVFNFSEKKGIDFTYIDNGIGFDLAITQKTSKGSGLISMQQRIKILKGSVQIVTSNGNGLKVFIKLPIIQIINENKAERQQKIIYEF